MDFVAHLTKLGCKVEPCGSRVTCNPPPVGTDQDYLVQSLTDAKTVGDVVSQLSNDGFFWEGSVHYQDAMANFMSWRKGDINLIVTSDAEFSRKHRAATALCKRLNLLDKADRVAVFQAVLYGNGSDGP